MGEKGRKKTAEFVTQLEEKKKKQFEFEEPVWRGSLLLKILTVGDVNPAITGRVTAAVSGAVIPAVGLGVTAAAGGGVKPAVGGGVKPAVGRGVGVTAAVGGYRRGTH